MNTDKTFCYKYPRPAYTVDALIYFDDKVLLIQRKNDPYKGEWALPGGFMDMNETPEQAVIRELQEETGLVFEKLIQFKTYGDINRDPRHRTISTVFYGNYNDAVNQVLMAGDDAKDTNWFLINDLPKLAFDHQEIIYEWRNLN